MIKGKVIRIPKLDDIEPYLVPEVKDLIVPSTGIYDDIPFDEYLRWDCFSKSAVKSLNTSAAHYKHYRDTPLNTKAIKEGRLLDCMLLEPELFHEQFIVPPDTYKAPEKKPTKKEPNPKTVIFDWSPYTSYCKEWKKHHESRGLIVVKEEDVVKAINCMKVIGSKPNIKSLFDGRKQVSIVWDDPKTGVRCKARFDILNNESIDDLKKTKDASWSDTGNGGFKSEIATYDYDCQGALYSDGWEVLTGERKPFNFIAVEYFPPFECASYSLREDSLMNGRIKYRKAMLIYQKIRDENKYNGYPDEMIDLDIPMFKMIDRDSIVESKMDLLMGI